MKSALSTVISYQWYRLEYRTNPGWGTPVGFSNATFTSPRDDVYLMRIYINGLYVYPEVKPVSVSMVGFVNASITGPLLSFQPSELLSYLPQGKTVSTYFNGSFGYINWHILGLSSLMLESCMFSVSSTRDIDTPQPILFDRVQLNQCSMYQASTGHFLAPKAGIYYLHINIGYLFDVQLRVLMQTQTQTLGSIQARYIATDKGYHMTAITVVQLSKGEPVWVELIQGRLVQYPRV